MEAPRSAGRPQVASTQSNKPDTVAIRTGDGRTVVNVPAHLARDPKALVAHLQAQIALKKAQAEKR